MKRGRHIPSTPENEERWARERAESERSQGFQKKGKWNGNNRKRAAVKNSRGVAMLCPLLAEYCKGDECAWWDSGCEMCAFTLAAGALHVLGRRGSTSGSSEIVRGLAEKLGGDA